MKHREYDAMYKRKLMKCDWRGGLQIFAAFNPFFEGGGVFSVDNKKSNQQKPD